MLSAEALDVDRVHNIFDYNFDRLNTDVDRIVTFKDSLKSSANPIVRNIKLWHQCSKK